MFALPPISPVGNFARTLVGPALSLTAVWTVLSVPGWLMQSYTCTADSVAVIDYSPCPRDERRFVGQSFDGQLREMGGNNNDVVEHNEILTHFTQTSTGQLTGWYMVQHDGKPYTGTLSQGQWLDDAFAAPHTSQYGFHWRDKYGTGTVNFSFNESTGNFDAVWSSDQNPNWVSSWTGTHR